MKKLANVTKSWLRRQVDSHLAHLAFWIENGYTPTADQVRALEKLAEIAKVPDDSERSFPKTPK